VNFLPTGQNLVCDFRGVDEMSLWRSALAAEHAVDHTRLTPDQGASTSGIESVVPHEHTGYHV
jgi:hypothetical protein